MDKDKDLETEIRNQIRAFDKDIFEKLSLGYRLKLRRELRLFAIHFAEWQKQNMTK